MLVFISWSGERSKKVAEALKVWLVQVIQAVEPWVSSDIEKGARWSPAISQRLEQSRFGIICLTRENLTEPWILFEAGALSKSQEASVCTLLIGLRPVDLVQPLAQFQATTTDKEDLRRLVYTINETVQNVGERYLSESILDEVFETYWPRLEGLIKDVVAMPDSVDGMVRSDREVLEEILELLRRQERTQTSQRASKESLKLLLEQLEQCESPYTNLFSPPPGSIWEASLREALRKRWKEATSKPALGEEAKDDGEQGNK